MRRLIQAHIILLLLACASCATRPAYEKVADGVVVRFKDGAQAKAVRLRVISPNIIQVVASAADTFSTSASLMVLPTVGKVDSRFTLAESGDLVSLVTPALQASINITTGEVSFADANGHRLLAEQRGGGKSFTPIAGQGYAIRQVFESPDDEAFYGLGGHQNGQMNYKGEDVELVQHNIVDVVPFIYSTRNYGILWDNYAISKFGDPREYQPLNTLKLFTRDGKEGGVTADYYVGNTIKETKVEDRIEFEYLETPAVENFPKDVSRNGKVVWEGSFTSETEGRHKFLVYASGYFKVWIDDSLHLDKWRQNWNPWTNKLVVDLRKGERHKIKIDWTPDDAGYMAVKHLDPLPAAEQQKLSLSSEVGDEINYYFIKGDNADEVIAGYRTLTGKAPIVPNWAMGFWQSRERYTNQKELVSVVKEYRRRRIPLDNIVLDWQYWEDPQWGSHEFDKTRFPDPAKMVAELHNDLHANLMISVWPKFNKGTSNYEEMNRKGFLFANNVERKRKDWVGVGYESTFYDPFNEEAGKLFWRQIDTHLNSIGIDAWWLDATEPDMHSNISIEARKANMNPTALGPGEKYFNAYSLVNARSVYEGQRQSSPDKRVFILTRSAYAGQQRYGAATWSGDIVARWSDFQDQIAAGINFSLSGIPYWTMDIGGFAVEKRYYNAAGATLDEWRELNTRWFQFGAFCPIFRSHGQYPYREIYNIAPEGSEAYNSMVYYANLRYHLMPYLYSLAGKTYNDDYTIMRGLVMDFPSDMHVRSIADQYMFGPALLVNPVYSYKARSRHVYLPATTGWYDFYTGEYFTGGQTLNAPAPLGRMPLYVKEGSILPAGPALQYVSEKPADPLTLYVYTGQDATFALYEDEGINYNYEKGESSSIPLHYHEASKSLTIDARKGSYKGMPAKRTINIVWIKKDHAAGVALAGHPDQAIVYEGQQVIVHMKN